MAIIHVAAECFPMAKVGGLADVVGALPKYQSNNTELAEVIMPFYNLPFNKENSFTEIYVGEVPLNGNNYTYKIMYSKVCMRFLKPILF